MKLPVSRCKVDGLCVEFRVYCNSLIDQLSVDVALTLAPLLLSLFCFHICCWRCKARKIETCFGKHPPPSFNRVLLRADLRSRDLDSIHSHRLSRASCFLSRSFLIAPVSIATLYRKELFEPDKYIHANRECRSLIPPVSTNFFRVAVSPPIQLISNLAKMKISMEMNFSAL